MKIISADEMPNLVDFLRYIKSGIVLLGEGSFGRVDEPSSYLDDPKLIELTRSYKISVVGTKVAGNLDSIVYVLKGGQIIEAQRSLDGTIDSRGDMLYNVSAGSSEINALIRICADAGEEYAGTKKADLLLVPHASFLGQNTRNIGIPELIDIHRKSLKKNALIVTADQHRGNEPIYGLDGKVVSQLRSYGDYRYHEATFKLGK